jgi:hypothetical protein
VSALVLEYYLLLRSVLRAKPRPRACLTRCRHCRIFFLTHPRNAARRDLGCPFGCREAHRRRASTRRSVEYYREPRGKKKKCDLNQRRASTASAKGPQRAAPGSPVPQHGSTKWNEPMVEHVRVVVSLIVKGSNYSPDTILLPEAVEVW